MPGKKIISDEVREQIIAIVNQFNKENALPLESSPVAQLFSKFSLSLPPEDEDALRVGAYVPRFRGAYVYLDRIGYNKRPSQICRLKWTGAIDNWEFAIYKYSDNGYDPDEWMFPGSGEVDGTIVGAMRAGNLAYPV